MINGKKVIAIIPARGGSKGLPGKNIIPLLNKPLIAWSIEVASKSKYIDETIISTDSKEIAEIAKKYGGKIPFIRPNELAQDVTPSIDVVIHALNFFAENNKIKFDYCVLLEPTSPIRDDNDIDNMLLKLDSLRKEYDAITSLGAISEPINLMKYIRGENLISVCNNLKKITRRQDSEQAFFPYGVAYISKVSALRNEKTFFTKRLTYYKIKDYQCYEIDNFFDYIKIEAIIKYLRRKK